MGNKRNKRSRRLETPSLDRGLSKAQAEAPNQGNETSTNVNTVVEDSSSGDEIRPRLVESSQISNEIQAWAQNSERKNNDTIMKMREEMEQVRCNFEKYKTLP